MSVRAKYCFDTNALDSMSMTISVTMAVEEWRNLMRSVPVKNYETNMLGQAISCALGDLAKATERQYVFNSPEQAG